MPVKIFIKGREIIDGGTLRVSDDIIDDDVMDDDVIKFAKFSVADGNDIC